MHNQRQDLNLGAKLFIDGLRLCAIAINRGDCYPCSLVSEVDQRLRVGAHHLEEMATLLICFSRRKLNLNRPESAQLSADESILIEQIQTIELGQYNPQEVFKTGPLHPKLHNLYCLAAILYLEQVRARALTRPSLALVEETGERLPNHPVCADPQGNSPPSKGKQTNSLRLAYPADRLPALLDFP